MQLLAARPRMLGFGGRTAASVLQADLQRATHADTIDVPRDAVLALLQSSSNEEDRRAIMQHIAVCLSDMAAVRWRRVYLAMHVLEELFKNGPDELISETAEGAYFDFEHRTSILEHYEYSYDDRVQGLVRKKAASLRTCWRSRREILETSAHKQSDAKRGGPFSRSGFVSMGHSDDTTDDDASDDESTWRCPKVTHRKSTLAICSGKAEDSTTDGDSSRSSASSPRAVCAFSPPESPLLHDLVTVNALLENAPPSAPHDLLELQAPVPMLATEPVTVDWSQVAREQGLSAATSVEDIMGSDCDSKSASPRGPVPSLPAAPFSPTADLLYF